jgi:hypothetical protein
VMLKQREDTASDPAVLMDFWTRMSAMKADELPSVEDINQAVETNHLNAKHAGVPLLQARRARLDFFANKAETLYDKLASEAEQNLNTRMTITGIFDIDQEAQVKKGIIIKELRDRWFERRNSGENPQDWVEELYGNFVRSTIHSGKINWDAKAMRSILPEGVQSSSDLIKLRTQQGMSDREFRNAMKLLDTINYVEAVQNLQQSGFKPTGKSSSFAAPQGGKAATR